MTSSGPKGYPVIWDSVDGLQYSLPEVGWVDVPTTSGISVIKQIVFSSMTATQSTTSGTYSTTTLAVTVVPKSATSTLVVTLSGMGQLIGVATDNAFCTIKRDGVDLGTGGGVSLIGEEANNTGDLLGSMGATLYLPSTSTASTTFEVFFKTNGNGGRFLFPTIGTATIGITEFEN